MGDGPEKIDEIDGWVFRRWSFDGAPLEAHRIPRHRRDGAYIVEIDAAGELVFCDLEDGDRPCVPEAVLRRLVADAIRRGAWKESEDA